MRKKGSFIVLSALMFCFAVTISSCGYTTQTVLPRQIKTIYVDTVKNKIEVENIYSYQPGLEMSITNAVSHRLEIDGNLKVANAREEADAALETNLIAFEQSGLRFTSLERVEEFRMYIVVAVRLIDLKTGDVIWEESDLSGDAEYYVSDIRSIAREEASQRAVEDLAKNIVDRIVEDW